MAITGFANAMALGTSPPRSGTPSSLNPNRWRLFLHNLGHNLSFVPRRQKRVDGGGANASGECSHSPARDSARHPLVPHRLWSAPLHLGAVLPADRKLLIHRTHG